MLSSDHDIDADMLPKPTGGREPLRALMDHSIDAMYLKDLDLRFVLVNRATMRIFTDTLRHVDVIGRRIIDLIATPAAAELEAMDRRVLATGQPASSERAIRCPDGGERIFAILKSPWRDAGGRLAGIVGVVRDVTEQRLAERRLVDVQAGLARAGRLSALGAVAAVLAHEISQPLTAAANYLAVATRKLDGHDRGRAPWAGAIEHATLHVLRAGEVVRNLRDFVIRGAPDLRHGDLCEVTADACLLARSEGLVADMDLLLSHPAGCCPALIDSMQMRQVLVNLIRNAAEAMRECRAHGATPPPTLIEVAVAPRDGSGWRVSVTDTGPGVAAELDRVLSHPFASRKPAGMGVGLAIVRTIVEGHGGQISVSDVTPGPGVRVCFTLPAANGVAANEPAANEPAANGPAVHDL